MNKSNALGEFRNTWKSNLAGVVVVGTVVALGAYKLIGVLANTKQRFTMRYR